MRSLMISKKLFLETSGLNDDRNNMANVNQLIDGCFDSDGMIFYHAACNLVKELYDTGKYWMWSPDSYPKRLLDHIDDWITAGFISFDYK